MNIGERLTQERKRLGLSQAYFAKRVGVSLSSQKRYESGEREPDTSYLEGARRLGVDITYVLTNSKRTSKEEWVDDFHLAMVGMAFAKLNGITKNDLNKLIESVESAMNNPDYKKLSPDDNLDVYDEMFLIELSNLLNSVSKKDAASDVDTSILSEVLEGLELALQESNRVLPPAKKAAAVAMLYRLFNLSGQVDKKMIAETITLAST